MFSLFIIAALAAYAQAAQYYFVGANDNYIVSQGNFGNFSNAAVLLPWSLTQQPLT